MTTENKHTVEVLYSEEDINKRISDVALQIQRDFKGKEPLIVAVLKGSFVFCSDLIRKLDPLYKVDFITMTSYEGTQSTGKVRIVADVREDIAGKDIIIVEDIADTGLTLNFLKKEFATRNPKSISVCVLLDKTCKRVVDADVEYRCFEVADKFVVGYGLDYNGLYRGLPYIGEMKL